MHRSTVSQIRICQIKFPIDFRGPEILRTKTRDANLNRFLHRSADACYALVTTNAAVAALSDLGVTECTRIAVDLLLLPARFHTDKSALL